VQQTRNQQIKYPGYIGLDPLLKFRENVMAVSRFWWSHRWAKIVWKWPLSLKYGYVDFYDVMRNFDW